MALTNIIVFAASQECRREWEDDTVESSGGGSAFSILLQAPLIPNNGAFKVRSDGERAAPTQHRDVVRRFDAYRNSFPFRFRVYWTMTYEDTVSERGCDIIRRKTFLEQAK